jgi:cyclase
VLPVRDRRDFLQLLLGAGVGLSCVRGASASSRLVTDETARGPLALTNLAPNLVQISGAGGNVVVIDSPDGLVLVNGGTAERSADLMKTVAERFGSKPVKTLFNTDWHAEHTGSNEAFAKTGSQIVAHEHTKQYLGTELHVEWQTRVYKPRPAQALPTKTFYTTGSMAAGQERIEYAHLGQAHTDGDVYLFLPAANVLIAGDVLTVGTYPIADYTTGGWLGGLVTANKTLLDKTNADTRIVPGTGPVQTRADLQAQHDMLSTMRDRFVKMMRQGMGTEDMLAAGVTKEYDARWGDPRLFVSTSYRGLWLHVRELGGIV